jgi:hypothetical protein
MHPLYAYTYNKAGQPGVKHDVENTEFGWRTEGRIESEDIVPPIKCQMERPPMKRGANALRTVLTMRWRRNAVGDYAPNICPPSTLTVWPVTQAASGEHRNSTRLATSSGLPMRPNGMLLSMPL